MELEEVIILIFVQGLWFVKSMEGTLINPNQCQYFGIPTCDDPNYYHRSLGIKACFNNHIKMLMVVSKCGFITRYTTYDKIETC